MKKYLPICILIAMLNYCQLSYTQKIEDFCEGWSQGLAAPGLSDPAEAMVADNQLYRLYVGGVGRFAGLPGLSTLAYLDWDGRWHSIGNFQCTSCGNGQINTLIVDDSSYLYIGGFFEGVEDLQGNYVASKNVIRYNPHTETFEALGLGLEANQVHDLAWRTDTLFAGGSITFAKNTNGDIAVNNMALYDLQNDSWHAMGQGIGSHNLSTDDNGDVNALAVGEDGFLYAAGRFSKINASDTVFSVAKWSPNGGWEKLAEELFLAYSNTSTKYPPLINDIVYAGGNHQKLFATGFLGYNIGGKNVLAAYDGQKWDYIGGGKPNSTGAIFHGTSLHYTDWLNEVHVGGNFNKTNDVANDTAPGNYIATYVLIQNFWFSHEGGITKAQPGAEVSSIAFYGRQNGGLFFSGNFTEVDTIPVNYLARYYYGWPLGFHTNPGLGAHDPCDEIRAIAQLDLWNSTNILLGGKFSKIGNTYSSSLALYDSEKGFTSPFGGEIKRNFFEPEVNDIFVTSQNLVLVAGAFDSTYQTLSTSTFERQTPGLTMYHPFLGLWIPVVNTLGGNGVVYAASEYKQQFLMGGDFTTADGATARGLALLDTATNAWRELAHISGGHVRDILVVGDSLIYIGGTFSQVNGQNIAGVAVYDGTGWSELGQNFAFYDNVYALGWDAHSQELIVGGAFDRVQQSNGNDLMTQGLAFWDGDQWSTRGSVEARFTNPAQYAPIVYSIDSRPNGEIFIGGEFSGIAGINTDRIAQWLPGSGWQALMDGGLSENACYVSQNPAVKAVAAVESQNKLYLGGTFNRSGKEPAGKFASFGMGAQSETAIIDSLFTLACFPLYIRADTNFKDISWSFGGNDHWQEIPQSFMNRPERWLSVTGTRNGCVYTDSLLMVRGQNINVYPSHEYRWRVDTLNRTVAFWFPVFHHFNDTLSFDYGDGTIKTYSRQLGNMPDTFYHTYTAPGIYPTRFWMSNFCAGIRLDTTFDFSSTGLSRQAEVAFKLYPNPNSGSFQLQYQSASGGGRVQLELFDMLGRSLWQKDVQAQELAVSKEIRIDGLKPGRYVLRMLDGKKSGRKILVVK